MLRMRPLARACSGSWNSILFAKPLHYPVSMPREIVVGVMNKYSWNREILLHGRSLRLFSSSSISRVSIAASVSKLHSESDGSGIHLEFFNAKNNRLWRLFVRPVCSEDSESKPEFVGNVEIKREWGVLNKQLKTTAHLELVSIGKLKSIIKGKIRTGYVCQQCEDVNDLRFDFLQAFGPNIGIYIDTNPSPKQDTSTSVDKNMKHIETTRLNLEADLNGQNKTSKSMLKQEFEVQHNGNLFIRLLKKKDSEAERFWEVKVSENVSTRYWGVTNTDKIQTSTRVYDNGKQKRTPNEQATFEAVSQAKQKIRLGYHLEYDSLRGIECHQLASDDACEMKAKTEQPPLPMLATKVKDELFFPEHHSTEFYVQPKLDGLRCIVDLKTGQLWSRTRKRYYLNYLEVFFRGKHTEQVRWLDGELYKHGVGIQEINSIVRNEKNKIGPSGQGLNRVSFHAFDTVLDLPFSERQHVLNEWFESHCRVPETKCEEHTEKENINDIIKLVDTLRTTGKSLKQYHDNITAKGYEGIMVRMVEDTGYVCGKRSVNLQKFKTFLNEEFECIDIIPRRKTVESKTITGSLVLRTANGTEFNAAPKCSHEEKRDIWLNRDEYTSGNYRGIIQFFEYTSSGVEKVPRCPVLVGFRHIDDM